MIIQTEVVEIVNKGRFKGTSKKNGNEFDLPQIMVKTKDNVNYTFTLPNEMLYEKISIGTKAKIKYYIDIRGNITINDIGE